MTKINPFQPNKPASIGMFAGRYDEIEMLDKGLYQTKYGQSSNFIIIGERGIGKSSLMMILEETAKGNVHSFEGDKFNFVTVNLILSEKTTLVSLINLIEINLSREIGKVEVIKEFLSKTWKFVQRIKIMDSGIDSKTRDTESDALINELAHSLAETCSRITNPEKGEEKKDGIVFLIDEADNAGPDLRIGYFFKVVTELLQRNRCDNIMFVAAGLPEFVEKLSASHESSVRIFNQIKIGELGPDDRKYVIDKGIEKANEINSEQTTITENAKSRISTFSERYPHFLQQFAHSAFDINSNGEITDEDVVTGAMLKGGAIDAIGDRYYASAFFDKIKSDEYRQVLQIMAESMNSWIKKNEIRDKFTGEDQTLTDALRALTTRKIILKNTSRRGEYRLQ